jgi:hypothetical protein
MGEISPIRRDGASEDDLGPGPYLPADHAFASGPGLAQRRQASLRPRDVLMLIGIVADDPFVDLGSFGIAQLLMAFGQVNQRIGCAGAVVFCFSDGFFVQRDGAFEIAFERLLPYGFLKCHVRLREQRECCRQDQGEFVFSC